MPRGRKPHDPVTKQFKLHYSRLKYRHTHEHHDSLDTLFTFDEYKSIVLQPCYYCGRPPSIPILDGDGNVALYKSTIDRVVSDEIGYRMTNVVPCCLQCNRAKNDGSVYELFVMAKRIYENHNLSELEIIDDEVIPDGAGDISNP